MENTQFSPPTPSNPSTSFLVLALSILGIIIISLLLLLYYLFVNKCCQLSWYQSGTDTISRRLYDRYNQSNYPVLHSTSVETRGLSESSIQAIPTIRYKKDSTKIGFHECAICINEFRDEERIRVLPNCFHVFHIDCIDTWLQNNANCPLCRAPITSYCPNNLMNLVGPTSQERANGNNNDIVIDVRSDELHGNNEIGERNERKLKIFSGSLGDECLNSRNKDDLDFVPMRRSFSMDSSSDAQLYIALQKILQNNSDNNNSSSSSSSNCDRSGKLKRGFFSFNHNRCSKSAVLPI